MWNPEYYMKGVVCRVYALQTNRGRIFYIGVTRSPLKIRLGLHMSKARTGGSAPVNNELRKLKTVNIVELQRTTNLQKSLKLEMVWVRHYLTIGVNLSNVQITS